MALVLLIRDGRIRLYLKAPTCGVAAIALLAAMLLVHSVGFIIFDKIAALEGVPPAERVTSTSEMRSDTIQFNQALGQNSLPRAAERNSSTLAVEKNDNSIESTMPKWASLPFKLFEQSEPFIIQATLVGVVPLVFRASRRISSSLSFC